MRENWPKAEGEASAPGSSKVGGGRGPLGPSPHEQQRLRGRAAPEPPTPLRAFPSRHPSPHLPGEGQLLTREREERAGLARTRRRRRRQPQRDEPRPASGRSRCPLPAHHTKPYVITARRPPNISTLGSPLGGDFFSGLHVLPLPLPSFPAPLPALSHWTWRRAILQ